MDTHLGYTLAYQFTIAKINALSTAALEDAGLADLVFEIR